MKNTKWTLGQILDLEYLLNQDTHFDDKEYLKKRDSDIYHKVIIPKGNISSSKMLLIWVQSMKPLAASSIFIGDIYEEVLNILRFIFIICGFTAGISLCITFFSYTGKNPLNIAYFLTLMIVPQIFLLLMLLLFFTISKIKSLSKSSLNSNHCSDNNNFSQADNNLSSVNNKSSSIHNNFSYILPYRFFYLIFSLIFEKIFILIHKSLLKKVSLEKQDALLSAVGILKQSRKIYGVIFFIPIFITIQLFGIAFNFGVLLAAFFRIIFFDTAFGWQSTLQISPQIVDKAVNIIAFPWIWLFPSGFGVPAFEQIAGSRIILKDGIYHLASNDLASWWSFLCLAIIFYGLLPRVIMFLSGVISLRKSLDKHKFDHLACLNLLERMKSNSKKEFENYIKPTDLAITSKEQPENKPTDLPTSKEQPENKKEENRKESKSKTENIIKAEQPFQFEIKEKNKAGEKFEIKEKNKTGEKFEIKEKNKTGEKFEIKEKTETKLESKSQKFIALIPIDVIESVDLSFLENWIKNSYRCDIINTISIGIDFDNELYLIRESFKNIKNVNGVILIQEAWQPPIKENLNFIKSIRRAADEKMPIIAALIGKINDKSQNIFEPVDEKDFQMWRMKIASIADPWLSMEKKL